MAKEILAVFNDTARMHNPPFDIYSGLVSPSFDTAARASSIIDALTALNATEQVQITQPREFGMPFIYSVHDHAYIDFLRKTSDRMAHKPPILVPEIDPTTGKAVIKEYPAFTYPSVFPHGSAPRSTNSTAQRGIYSFDTATPVMGNTFEVAMNAAYTALTAADALVQGHELAYALCRPPGHHAEEARMGGYCYLNNASIAARYLRDVTGKRVGIIDIDAHHGNGTQEIFYDSADVFFASIHADPSEIPPYYSGYADEKGKGAGYGNNLNIPLPLGSDDMVFLSALDRAISQVKQFAPSRLIISLGFDGYKDDPLKIFNITTDGYAEVARRISSLGLPILSVQEGGYAVAVLGMNVATFLKSLKNSRS